MLNMEEKEQFLKDIQEKANDKEVTNALKFEDNIQYRFDLVREDAFEQGIKQTIISMSKKNFNLDIISDITSKSIEEIKQIISSNEKN